MLPAYFQYGLENDYHFIEDAALFSSVVKLNYSNKQLADECFIKAYGLLSEKGILDQELILIHGVNY